MADFTINDLVHIIIERLKSSEDFKEERKELIPCASFFFI